MTDITQRAIDLADSLASTVTTISMGDSFEMNMEAAERMILSVLSAVQREALKEAAGLCRDKALAHADLVFLGEKCMARRREGMEAAYRASEYFILALIDAPATAPLDPRDAEIERSASCDDTTVMRLWRECGLPEYFLGNGGTNHKLVAFMDRIRSEGEIERGAAEMPLSDVYNLDDVVVALGIEDSDTTPAEAVSELHAEIERLREIVNACGLQFRDYERQHLAKSPPDIAKAKTNAGFAERCEGVRQTPDRDPPGAQPQ